MVLFSYSSNNHVQISHMYLRLSVLFVFVLLLFRVLDFVLGLVLWLVGLYLYLDLRLFRVFICVCFDNMWHIGHSFEGGHVLTA